MDLSRAQRINHEVATFTRDEIVQAIDAVAAIPCDDTPRSYEAIEKAKKILQEADCRLTKLFDGHCPCERCNPVPTELDGRSLFKRIGAVQRWNSTTSSPSRAHWAASTSGCCGSRT